MLKYLLWICLFWANMSFGQTQTSELSPQDFLRGKDVLVDHVLVNSEKYRLQWIFTPLDIDSSGNYHPTETFDYSTDDYFYPASVVKLPTALLTLEKLNEQNVSSSAILKINKNQFCGNMEYADRTKRSSLSFKTMIEEMISISDNAYYNALYHFLTPEVFYQKMSEKGFLETKIYKSFTGCDRTQNLFCNSLSYYDPISKENYFQKKSQLDLSVMEKRYSYSKNKLLGSNHEAKRKIVDGPFDFNYNLEYPLHEIHGTMERFFYPQHFALKERWNVRDMDKKLVLQSLVQFPREMTNQKYHDPKKYPDNYYKYIALGDANPSFNEVRTYSKIGLSYGFVTETALVLDEKQGKAYLLSVSMYVNENDTVNDGDYEYEEVARPFLAKLGQLLLDYH